MSSNFSSPTINYNKLLLFLRKKMFQKVAFPEKVDREEFRFYEEELIVMAHEYCILKMIDREKERKKERVREMRKKKQIFANFC